VRESLFGRQSDGGIRPLGDGIRLAAALMQERGNEQTEGQGGGVADAAGECNGGVEAVERLVGVAPQPQVVDRMKEAQEPRVLSIGVEMRAMSGGVVEGESRLQVCPGGRQIPLIHQQGPHPGVRLHEQIRVVLTLGQAE
jgi:hypothetical protein